MKIRNSWILAGVACLLGIHNVRADRPWTYAECVAYARENNITLKKSLLAEQTAAINVESAKAQWEPTLDFSTTQGYTNSPWGQRNANTYSSNYGLSAGWTVWDGGVRTNTIRQNEIALRQAKLAKEDYFRTLETDLLQVYLNLLYAQEAIGINTQAVELSRAQAERGQALLESGRISKVDYAQLKSQYEQDKYNLVNARSTFDTRKMELRQLLELGIGDDPVPVEVECTEEKIMAPLPPKEETYALARGLDLQIAGYELAREASEVEIKTAKAGKSPKISLNAGVGTSYYAPGGAFGTSLKQGWNENIGVSLSLPILDQKKTRTDMARAKIGKLESDLDIDKREVTLGQLIENWYIDTRSAQSRYKAAEEQLAAASLTDELTNERFRLGYVNPVELLTAHTALIDARYAVVQAKYMAILGQKMIEYYRTAKITLDQTQN